MSAARTNTSLAGPGIMLLSAGIFGYFGFTSAFSSTGSSGEYLLYVDLFAWTLKASAVAFATCAAVALIQPVVGNVLYGVVGLLSAISLVTVAVMDIADTNHMVMHPFLIFLFAAWNGFGAISSLREVMVARTHAPPAGGPAGA